jgi:hypothetical protein
MAAAFRMEEFCLEEEKCDSYANYSVGGEQWLG